MSGTMRKVVPLAFISALVLAGASCSLFVSLDGLSDADAGAADSGDELCVCVDAGKPDSAPPPQDAGEDSGVDAGINPCKTGNGTAGPRMIEADGYCIDSTEVTIAQYMQFVTDGGAGVSQAPVCAWNVTYAPAIDGTGDPRCTPGNVDPLVRPDNPITCVDWCDAFAYCEWAGKRLCGAITGGSLTYDNITANSQWYLACATTASNTYPNDSNDGGSCILGGSGSIPVGTSGCNGGYPGLSDMVGNVEEWVDSCDNAGEADGGGGTSFDRCHDLGDEWDRNFQGNGCPNFDDDNRRETWAGIGFRCCSK